MKTEWMMPAAGAGAGLVILLLFGGFWLGLRKRRLRMKLSGGEWLNALGFGLLPALTVYKAFEQYMPAGSAGGKVLNPLPGLPWLTENGSFFPARIELALFLAAFLTVCLWMMIRKNDLPPNGDLLGVSMTLWAGIRTATESLRTESQLNFGDWRAVYLAGLASVLIWMIVWTSRRRKRIKNTSQIILYWLVVLLCTAALWATVSGTVSTGSGIGDLAVSAGCGAFLAAAVLTAGGESRKD